MRGRSGHRYLIKHHARRGWRRDLRSRAGSYHPRRARSALGRRRSLEGCWQCSTTTVLGGKRSNLAGHPSAAPCHTSSANLAEMPRQSATSYAEYDDEEARRSPLLRRRDELILPPLRSPSTTSTTTTTSKTASVARRRPPAASRRRTVKRRCVRMMHSRRLGSLATEPASAA
jgi:hypothetical protein